MRKNSFFVLLLVCLGIGCHPNSKYSSSCPLVVGPRGAQLYMSLESAMALCNNRVKSIQAQKMDESPYYGTDRSYDIYQIGKNDNMMLVSKASDRYYEPPSGKGANFLMHRGLGDFAYWLGYEEVTGNYYLMSRVDSTLREIGYSEDKYRVTPEGKSILMSKGVGKKDFFAGDAYGKVYMAKGEREVEQVGFFDYFIFCPDEGKDQTRTIVMTKGMGSKEKWFGELDGVIYIME